VAMSMWERFFTPNYSDEVNVPQTVYKDLENKIVLRNIDSLMFESAESHVLSMLSKDPFVRFVKQYMVGRAKRSLNEQDSTITQSPRKMRGLGDCFCITDPRLPDNPIINASDGFLKVTNYKRSEIVGKNCRFLQGDQTNRNVVKKFSEHIKACKEVTDLLLNYKADGTPFWNLLFVCPLKSLSGQVDYFLGGQVDITEVINSKAALNELLEIEDDNEPAESSKSRSRGFLPSLTLGLSSFFGPRGGRAALSLQNGAETSVVDAKLSLEEQTKIFYDTYSQYLLLRVAKKEAVIGYVSRRLASRLGYQPEQLVGNSLKTLFCLEDKALVKRRVRAALTKAQPLSMPILCAAYDGTAYRTHLHITPLKDLNGCANFFVVVFA